MTIVILIRKVAPVKALADSGVTIGAAAVAKDNVIAHTTDQRVVIRATENLVIALGPIDPVIARTGGHDVVVANLTGQDRVQRVDQIAIGITQIGAIDDVAAIGPLDDAIAQHIGKVKAEVADTDIAALVVAIAVVVDDLQTHDRARDVDVDGVRVACAIDVGVPVGGAFDRVAIHGLQGGVDVAEIDGNQIAIGVIGQNGHLVVPLTVGRVDIVEREGHIAHRLVKGQDRGRRLRDVVAGQIAVAVDEKACVAAAGRGRDRHPKAVTTGREQAEQAVSAQSAPIKQKIGHRIFPQMSLRAPRRINWPLHRPIREMHTRSTTRYPKHGQWQMPVQSVSSLSCAGRVAVTSERD